jgi:hypothetical protein
MQVYPGTGRIVPRYQLEYIDTQCESFQRSIEYPENGAGHVEGSAKSLENRLQCLESRLAILELKNYQQEGMMVKDIHSQSHSMSAAMTPDTAFAFGERQLVSQWLCRLNSDRAQLTNQCYQGDQRSRVSGSIHR